MSKYYVVVTTEKPPIRYSRGYTLLNAQTFARLGTQRRKDGSKSDDRAVTRGKDGPVIRVYSDGERVWPVYAEQVNRLTGKDALSNNEIPGKLIFKIGGKDRWLSVKPVRAGGYWRAVPL